MRWRVKILPEEEDSIQEVQEKIERRWEAHRLELPKNLSAHALAEYEYHWRLEHDEYYSCYANGHRDIDNWQVRLHHVSDNIFEGICVCGGIVHFELLNE